MPAPSTLAVIRSEAEYLARAEAALDAAMPRLSRMYRAACIATHIACEKAFDRGEAHVALRETLETIAKVDAPAAKRLVAAEMARAA